MIEHARITSAYDYEVLLGGQYFVAILQAMYDAGNLPRSVNLGNVTVLLESPSAVEVLPPTDSADLEVTVPYALGGVDGEVGLRLTLEATAESQDADAGKRHIKIKTAFIGLDPNTESILASLGILEAARASLRSALAKSITIRAGRVPILEIETRRVPAERTYQSAWGLYINKSYLISPPPGPPETGYIARGNTAEAQSFLPADADLVLGVSQETYRRLAANKWHGWRVLQSDGSWRHPLTGADGEYRSVNIFGNPGLLTISIKGEVFVDNWFDADLTIRYEVRPRLRNGGIDIESRLAEFDADTGFLGDLFAVLIGAALPFPSGIGPLEAVVGYNIVENIMEDRKEGVAESKKSEIAAMFDGIPESIEAGSSRPDPFYELIHKVLNRYREVNVDAIGMTFAATPEVVAWPRPVAIKLIDKVRGDGGIAGLLTLIYRVTDFGEVHELTTTEVLRRISAQELARAVLRPVTIRRENTVITEIKFETGLSLRVSEAIALQLKGAIWVAGCQLIRPRGKRPYFRDSPDADPGDNLESLPSF